jgi:putative endonuclease
MEKSNWFVYMLLCSDGTLYTGITNNLDERIAKHNSGKGAKYTRSRTPVVLKAYWSYNSRSDASKAEFAFKKLSRDQKMKMIRDFESLIIT